MKTVIIKKEIEVPLDALIDVADVLIANNLTHSIVDTDAEEDTVLMEVEYMKGEGHLFRELEAIISEYEEEGDDDNEEEDDEDDA